MKAAWIASVVAQLWLVYRWRARRDAWWWLMVLTVAADLVRVQFDPRQDRAEYRDAWMWTQPVLSAALLAAALSLPSVRVLRGLGAAGAVVAAVWLALLAPAWHDGWTQRLLYFREVAVFAGLGLSIGAALVPHRYRWFAPAYFGIHAARAVAAQWWQPTQAPDAVALAAFTLLFVVAGAQSRTPPGASRA